MGFIVFFFFLSFDVTEVAVPWKLLTKAGVSVIFATEKGNEGPIPQCDPLLIKGVIFGKLGAEPEPILFYNEMINDSAFKSPISWKKVCIEDFDGLILPGGHAQGMKQYLGSEDLFEKVSIFWKLKRLVGAICHGVLILARSNCLNGRKTTCLPYYMEKLAYLSTFWKLGNYYRTYPKYVEEEVCESLGPQGTFIAGPYEFTRGTDNDDTHAMVVEDENYISARWPGDAYLFAKTFLIKLTQQQEQQE
eukprot:c18372_g1_i1.p1 GENE.c18372_g1_i1~~c18372_g1_i1.p1  ORF type:complete len:248 (+),score=115.12 c18372_g1_i1:116-859(+)